MYIMLKKNHFNKVKCWWRSHFEVPVALSSVSLGGHGNRFVTTEPQFQHLKSSGVKFMNHFIDFILPIYVLVV